MLTSANVRAAFGELTAAVGSLSEEHRAKMAQMGYEHHIVSSVGLMNLIEAYERSEGMHGPNVLENLRILRFHAGQIHRMLENLTGSDDM